MAEDLWGKPPRRQVKGCYDACDYSPGGKIGPREAGSIFANLALIQSIVIPVAWELDNLASASHPGLPRGAVGFGAWISQTLFYLLLKIVANMLRNYGASWARDLGAWIWIHWMEPWFNWLAFQWAQFKALIRGIVGR